MKLIRLSICLCYADSAHSEIYALSLHDALPIFADVHLAVALDANLLQDARRRRARARLLEVPAHRLRHVLRLHGPILDRKSTRLNSSHANISYAVFCLKKKKRRNATSVNSSFTS